MSSSPALPALFDAPRLHVLAAALVAAAVAATVGATPAAAAPPSVTVRVTIDKISALDCTEGSTPLGCGGEADFYAIVAIDGEELAKKGPIKDDNNADPNPDWVFERQVDMDRGRVPVVVEVRDEDGGFRLGDDHIDIDSGNGGDTSNLDLQVNLAPCGIFGDVTGKKCGVQFTSDGSGGVRGRIFMTVEVIDADTDGDSLLDGWESRGLDTDGDGSVDVDLKAMGADPAREDIFVEVDCLVSDGNGNGYSAADQADHSHCPIGLALDDVVRAYANAPRSNPNGSTGVALHVDTGQLYGAGTVTNVAGGAGVTGAWGDIASLAPGRSAGAGGNQVLETAANQVVDWDGATGSPATSFYDIKSAQFDARRAYAFKYALFAHQNNGRQPVNDCTGGWAEGGPSNDFMITKGGRRDVDGNGTGDTPCWTDTGPNGINEDGDGATDEDPRDGFDQDGDCPAGNDANGDGTACGFGDLNVDEDAGFSVGSRAEQAGTFMHELGHTMGLDHGGNEDVDGKRNYLSVMQYPMEACGVPPLAGVLPGGCDYSRDDLADLVEPGPPGNVGLDECQGFDAGTYGFGPINWDGDRVGGLPAGPPLLEGATCAAPNQTNVSFDVNGNGTLTTLTGFDDWASLMYGFQQSDTFSDGTANAVANEPDPRVIEQARRRLSQQIAPDVAVDKTGPADATPGSTLTYSLTASNVGAGPALDVSLSDTKPDATTSSFQLGLLTLGSSATRTVTYGVPCVTADGTVLVDRATATAVDLLGSAEAATANNTDTVSTTVHAPVLTLVKTATPQVLAGERITYTLTYANVGSGAASGVVVRDTLPAGVYYSTALDTGAGPKPTSVTRNADGTTTLVWSVGAVAGSSGPLAISYAARPSLLFLGGAIVRNSARLTFTNENGCTYAPVDASTSSAIAVTPPTRDPLTHGYWRNHPEEWTGEILARIQATDQRFDGGADGALDAGEVTAALAAPGGAGNILRQQLLAVYFNLATRRVNAGTAISSRTASRLGLGNVRAAALFGDATLALPLAGNSDRYSDATTVLDEINRNRSEVYEP